MTAARAQGTTVLPAAVVLACALACGQWPSHASAEELAPPGHWVATAPGWVESRSQETRIGASVVGRIADVLVRTNDNVFAGELLVRLDDSEARARLAAAEAQVALRERARNSEKAKGSTARRRAEDEAAAAELEVARARAAFDRASADRHAGRASVAALDAARSTLARAEDHLVLQQDTLERVKADTPLPTRLEGELNAARAEVTGARAAVERTKVRAPFAATVLEVRAKVGEVVSPSPDPPLVLLGDLSALRVKAELDERDFAKVHVGQSVSVRAYAFADREFEGRVRSIGKYVRPGRATPPGSRNKSADFDVLEVIVDLTNAGPLLVGMQVDVYFSADAAQQQGAR